MKQNHKNMKFQKSFKKRIVVFLYVCLFSMPLMYSQTPTDNQNMHKINYKYGERIELKIDEVVIIDDSLSLKVTNFTHKRPYVGGSTMATVYVTASKNKVSEEILLSVKGKEGKSIAEDGLSKEERFSTVVWEGYIFQLEKFDYDTSIEVIILKE